MITVNPPKLNNLIPRMFELISRNTPWHLSEIIILAQSSSLAKISSLNPQKANLQKESVRSSYMPSLSLDGGYQYVSSGRSVLTPKHGSEILAKIELLLYDGGKREASLSALKHIETSEILKDEDFKNRLALDVCRLYFNYMERVGERETLKIRPDRGRINAG